MKNMDMFYMKQSFKILIILGILCLILFSCKKNVTVKTAKIVKPVYIDTEGLLNRLNNLPEDDSFQTFLLDKDNKVLLIGNPISNSRIGELYKQIITSIK